MKYPSPPILVVIISLALIGLIGIQFYWIDNAMELREQQFHQEVHGVMKKVVARIEHDEMVNAATKEMYPFGTGKKYFKNIDPFTNDSANAKMSIDTNGSRTIFSYKQKITNKGSSFSYEFKTGENEPDGNFQLKKQKFNQIIEKLMFNDLKNTGERISKGHLDTMIAEELVNVGITVPFISNVYDFNSNDFVYDTHGNADEIKQSAFKVNLYPNDFGLRRELLLVKFPNQSIFLLRQMWLILGSSIIFIILIIVAFYTTIRTIYRQKKISEVKNDFVNNMTHELKTPISTISLACEALSDPAMSSDKASVSTFLNIIKEENKRLGNLVERVLQASVLERTQIKLNIETLEMHNIINKAVNNIRIQIEKRGGVINLHFKATEDKIDGDKVHITNVIFNLLDNANKYTKNVPVIDLVTKNENNKFIIEIIDNGIGISKDDQKKIFEKFYRVPTGNLHDVKGFGLGLSYVNEICTRHNAALLLESDLGKGSKFIIKFNNHTNTENHV